ncbi:carboxymuconolactone decarboxylase family protein [Nocardioides sp. cx-173]|uniref:carboxymuconolactone decarboxylase family protein n=1 Tax=Nocardioides sp. cx-173 TaxID=2898796 RepID=UPI001E35886E|nr:carboxymuconolactone decarboxylase family protein [Nocardioides sp. cx-173]MCD4524256.1 carboxymuconolactone decarboxylase family protein [Nocardioides sp. cx-173]UGB41648.1 carboxymuconolactone decarboxylase family protein [Nocardioides sp. cx-173]
MPDEIADFAADSLKAVFKRGVLSSRDRRLLTIATLVSMGSVEPLRLHTEMAVEAGVSREEIHELILHVGFYAGFGRSTDAFNVTKEALAAGDA